MFYKSKQEHTLPKDYLPPGAQNVEQTSHVEAARRFFRESFSTRAFNCLRLLHFSLDNLSPSSFRFAIINTLLPRIAQSDNEVLLRQSSSHLLQLASETSSTAKLQEYNLIVTHLLSIS